MLVCEIIILWHQEQFQIPVNKEDWAYKSMIKFCVGQGRTQRLNIFGIYFCVGLNLKGLTV